MGSRLVLGMALVSLAACNPSADYALVGSAYVPSTQGEVRIEKIDKQQILINIVLDQLPSPDEVEPGLTCYVVWFIPVGEAPSRQGTLDYDAKAQVGRASIATSLREFEVNVTAEEDVSPRRPSALLVASQKIREK